MTAICGYLQGLCACDVVSIYRVCGNQQRSIFGRKSKSKLLLPDDLIKLNPHHEGQDQQGSFDFVRWPIGACLLPMSLLRRATILPFIIMARTTQVAQAHIITAPWPLVMSSTVLPPHRSASGRGGTVVPTCITSRSYHRLPILPNPRCILDYPAGRHWIRPPTRRTMRGQLSHRGLATLPRRPCRLAWTLNLGLISTGATTATSCRAFTASPLTAASRR